MLLRRPPGDDGCRDEVDAEDAIGGRCDEGIALITSYITVASIRQLATH